MATTQAFLQIRWPQVLGFPIIAKNSEVFAIADPVMTASGFMLVATAGTNRFLGYAAEAVTAAATNQTVAQYKPQYYPTAGIIMAYSWQTGSAAQTDVGNYSNLVGLTGAITINATSSATSGQFYILGRDPYNAADNTVVAVQCAMPQELEYATV